MRSLLLLACAAIVAVTSVAACSDGDGTQLVRRVRRGASSTTQDDTTDDHDETDVEGESQIDTGNPNATSTPTAPTSAGTAASDFAVTLTNATPVVDLGQETSLEVTVAPKGNFSGSVQLSVEGLPAGVTAAPATVSVSGSTKATLTLKADYGANVTPTGSSVPLVVTAKSGNATATANANFKVAPRVTVTIPVNVDALRGASQLRSEYGAAFGPNGTALKTQSNNGIVVTVFNADSKSHVIHGPGGNFPHGNTGAPIQPNSFEMNGGSPRTRTLTPGNTATAYLHDGSSGQGASFRIQVVAAN